ncbi:hypothetical protein H0H87_008736 [Tephrocybe sp. NHM501043]|nr:hypothetical protein H0H87_008736 [Tephrocybe sp. NHM501043]
MASSTPPDVDMRPLPSPSSDPTLSLRELALKTLKSRRRPAADTVPALPSRPPPPSDTSFQLDYGQEEAETSRDIQPSPVVQTAKSPVVPTPKPSVATTSTLPVATSEFDSQGREEGEISDEEEPQPPPPVQPKTSTSLPLPASSIPRGPRPPTPSTPVPVPSDNVKSNPPLFDRLSEPSVISGSLAFIGNEALNAMQVDGTPILVMNQDQYDKAKDIVLDLLGWGVDPSYLVDCGVTREVVYYVFNELNLRLPQNLDTTGLIPFTPTDAMELQKSTMMPPPPPPVQARRHSQSQPAAPTIPPLRTPSPSSLTPIARAPTTPLQTLESPRPVSMRELHDMEQQRRQELMARKAAIASKKSKQLLPSTPASPRSTPAPSLPSSSKEDADMNVDTVEDFLKTIGPSSTPIHTVGSSSTSFQPSADDMDVDEIPGLRRSNSYKAPTIVPHPSSSLSASVVSPTQSSHVPMSPATAPPSSTESNSTTFSARSFETTASSSATETRLSEGPALQRRGMKRPVASDFVDFENDSRSSSTNGFRHHNGHLKRRAGFASLVNQPRCIIDVSDSEGEGDVDISMRDVEAPWRAGYASPVPTKPFVAHLSTNGWATPPVSSLTPTITSLASTPNGTLSPAALAAKETEILKMREMIAHKERKLKEAKVALEAANKAETKVKREEIPVSISPDGGSSQISRLATPTADPPQPSARMLIPLPLPSILVD